MAAAPVSAFFSEKLNPCENKEKTNKTTATPVRAFQVEVSLNKPDSLVSSSHGLTGEEVSTAGFVSFTDSFAGLMLTVTVSFFVTGFKVFFSFCSFSLCSVPLGTEWLYFISLTYSTAGFSSIYASFRFNVGL